MLRAEPGRDESAFISYAIVDALLDLLVAKNLLTNAKVTTLLSSVADTLGKKAEFMGKRGAKIIRDGMPT